jgi:hypothetical protein
VGLEEAARGVQVTAVEREAVVTEVDWEAVEKAAAAMVAATAVEVQVADMEGSVDVERYD